MKAFLAVFLFAAAADAIWPAYPGLVHPTYYTGLPTAYTGVPLLKTLKPEEYTKTFEYKTGLPEMISPYWFPYAKAAKMPELETKYASQGEYRAEAAGNVVHIAKRSSEEDKAKLILPYAAPWAAPFVPAASWSPYTAAAWTPYNTAAWATPFYPHLMPKLVTDDRMKEGTPGKDVLSLSFVPYFYKLPATLFSRRVRQQGQVRRRVRRHCPHCQALRRPPDHPPQPLPHQHPPLRPRLHQRRPLPHRLHRLPLRQPLHQPPRPHRLRR